MVSIKSPKTTWHTYRKCHIFRGSAESGLHNSMDSNWKLANDPLSQACD